MIETVSASSGSASAPPFVEGSWVGLEESSSQTVVVLSQRQHDLYRSISTHCLDAERALAGALGPAVAVCEIVYAIERLGELKGIDAREAVLDRLFSRFCIGK